MAFPTTALLDDFNRANEAIIATNWTSPTFSDESDTELFANVVDFNPGSAHYDIAEYGPDCEVWATLPIRPPVGQVELRARIQGEGGAFASGSYYCVRLFDTASASYDIVRFTAGVASGIAGPSAITFSSGDGLGLSCIGTTIAAYHRAGATGNPWTPLASGTDATITAAGYLGIFSDDGGVTLDDFGGGTATAATILLPDADIVTTGWTTAPLFSKLNDASDATFITSTAA